MNRLIPGAFEQSSVPGIFLLSEHRITSLDDAQVEINSLWFNVNQQAARVRHLEKLADTLDSPWWKLALFVIDGWPLRRVVDKPQWRPWRRWWTS